MVLAELVPEPPGLSFAEAADRLAGDGPNELPRPARPLCGGRWGQLRDPLIVVLLIAATLTVVTGDWTDTSVIVLVIVVNTAVGVGQEVRADHAISALSELDSPEARVVRDGCNGRSRPPTWSSVTFWCSPREISSRPMRHVRSCNASRGRVSADRRSDAGGQERDRQDGAAMGFGGHGGGPGPWPSGGDRYRCRVQWGGSRH